MEFDVKVTIVKDGYKHEGRRVAVGTEIQIPQRLAQWLVRQGFASERSASELPKPPAALLRRPCCGRR